MKNKNLFRKSVRQLTVRMDYNIYKEKIRVQIVNENGGKRLVSIEEARAEKITIRSNMITFTQRSNGLVQRFDRNVSNPNGNVKLITFYHEN